ncbi:MAG: DNA-binding protein [Candidatus Aenigmatarchaeota archaeon]
MNLKNQADKEVEEIIRKILTKEARERLARLNLVKPELVTQLKLYLAQLYKAGRIKEVITDEKLKDILRRIS